MAKTTTAGISIRRSVAILLLVWLTSLTGLAQSPSPTEEKTWPTPTELRVKIEEVSRLLEQQDPEDFRAAPQDEIPDFRKSLLRLESTYRRQLTVLELMAETQQELETLAAETQSYSARGLDQEPPYSVAFLDELHSLKETAQQRLDIARLARSTAEKSTQSAQEELEEYGKLERRLREKASAEPQRLADLKEAMMAAEQEGLLGEMNRALAESQVRLAEDRFQLLSRKVDYVEELFRFGETALEEQLEQERTLREETTERLRASMELLEESEDKVENLLDRRRQGQLVETELEAQRAWTRAHKTEIEVLEERLQWGLERRKLWERRYLARRGVSSAEASSWEAQTMDFLAQLDGSEELLDSRLEETRAPLALVLEREGEESRVSQAQALLNQQQVLERASRSLNETQRLARRLLSELGRLQDAASWREKLDSWIAAFWDFWNIELYTIGDDAVTVRKFSVALVVLVVGLVLVRRVTRGVGKALRNHLRIKESMAVNFERLLTYLLTLLVFLFALHVVNIPLTIFTFLGGTLAIAFGFGAQAILNNFISGLILMVEQPINVGDLIKVEGTTGFVEEIGARSTRIRLPTGIHVIVPNSSLLENSVTNWTLRDRRMRVNVGVGVAYGSPVDQVMELLREAALSIQRVEKQPEPIVLFTDFGHSSLDFEVHFWVIIDSPMDRFEAETEVRVTIDSLFRKNNIEIPFPQRDVNLDKPVEVKILS